MQRPAKPCTPVRFRPPPPNLTMKRPLCAAVLLCTHRPLASVGVVACAPEYVVSLIHGGHGRNALPRAWQGTYSPIGTSAAPGRSRSPTGSLTATSSPFGCRRPARARGNCATGCTARSRPQPWASWNSRRPAFDDSALLTAIGPRAPADCPPEPRGASQRPKRAGALVRRAAKDNPVFHDEHVIGMPGP